MAKIACVGTRILSQAQAKNLYDIGRYLARKRHTVVTGNAEGSDHAFAAGASSYDAKRVELYLPFANFRLEQICHEGNKLYLPQPNHFEKAAEVWAKRRAATYGYGHWRTLADTTQCFMARNFQLVEASEKVIAAPSFNGRGEPAGGTAFALQCAEELGREVQILDLRLPPDPEWDRCPNCEIGRTVWACGDKYHRLKAYC